MNALGEIILLHVVLGCAIGFCVAILRGGLAERVYEARMSSRLGFFLMPGRLGSREVWVRLQRALAWFGLVPAVAVLILLWLPPWWGRLAYRAHIRTGLPYVLGWPPKHFTGVWRNFSDDGRHNELSYRHGERDGAQRFYDANGALVRSCEFKNGEPWSGLCDFWEDKPWLAEYRDGKVWKGAMSEPDRDTNDSVMKYYFEGQLCSEAEYRQRMGFGDDDQLIGVMGIKSRPR